MKNADVWFVIVTYKPDKEALGRLLKVLAGWPVEIVDNTQKNVGFGSAANRGMREAFGAGAEWVVVLNQDVRITRAGITQFCAMTRNCDPGVMGPEAGSLDQKRWTTILNEGKYKFHKVTPCSTARCDLGEPVYISGSMMAVHRKVWETIGGFYESYFLYYEDVDLCVRATRAGFTLTHVPIAEFAHTPHGNRYYLARNHLWFVWRLAPWRIKLRELVRLPKTVWEYVYDNRR